MKNLEVNTLNINSNSLLNIATFRQEDNATLMLELYKNGQSIDLTGQKIILGAERSDGSIIEQEEDISTNENIVTIKLKKNILAVNGLVKMQLTLSDREGTMSTTSFNINVDRKILGAENIKASNDIETINSLVLDLKTNVNKAITDTKDKASTLLSGLEDTANSVELKVNALTDISNGLLKNLENQCKDSTIINTELSNNIKKALPINKELKENIRIGQPLVQDVIEKNTALQVSLKKTKEFIDGLNGSQNIPQLRLDITELQNGLKINQSLTYKGSSVVAQNSFSGKTENMKIKGRTLQNLCIKNSYDFNSVPLSIKGDYFEFKTDNKFSFGNIVSDIKNLKPNTEYTLIYSVLENTLKKSNRIEICNATNFNSTISIDNETLKGTYVKKVMSKHSSEQMGHALYLNCIEDKNYGQTLKFSLIILEGDYTQQDFNLEYFEGIKSFGEVEREEDKYRISLLSHGVNLANIDKIIKDSPGCKFEDGYLKFFQGNKPLIIKDIFKPNTSYIISGEYRCYADNQLAIKIYYTDGTNDLIQFITYNKDTYNSIVSNNNKTIKEIKSEWTFSNLEVGIKNLQIKEKINNDFNSQYEQYKQDKKDILIKEPLRGLSENTCDVMYENNRQVKIDRYVKEYTFTGNEDITISVNKPSSGNYLRVFFQGLNNNLKQMQHGNLLCTTLQPKNLIDIPNEEGISITQGIDIQILKSRLSSPDIEGFKSWLKSNPTTIIYQLATPVTEVAENCVDIDLDTFEEKTYFNILNSLPGSLDFKVPSNIASIVQSNSKAINEIYNLIDTLILPNILQNTTDIEMLKLEKLK